MMVAPASVFTQHIRAGKLRALAYTLSPRAPFLPDVPTLAEAGLPGTEIEGGWFAMFAPGRTPGEIVSRVHAEIRKSLDDPAMRKRILDLNNTPVVSSPAEFRQYLTVQIAKYAEMAKLAGVEPE